MTTPPPHDVSKHLVIDPQRVANRGQDDAPPNWLLNAITAVLSDMQLPCRLSLRVAYQADREIEHSGVVSFLEADGHGFGFGVSNKPDTLLVGLAEGLQENLADFAETWGQALPPCPGHAHPTRPVQRRSRPWWSCPDDGRLLALIGELHADKS